MGTISIDQIDQDLHSALKSDATEQVSAVYFWKRFRVSSIFDFCNSICQKQTSEARLIR